MKTAPILARPVVDDYRLANLFLNDLLIHYKTTSNFSIRQRVKNLKGCSSALVSQVLKGKRRLTRDQLPHFAKLFKLTTFEIEQLDKGLFEEKLSAAGLETNPLKDVKRRSPKNHILSSWLNVYVKDLVNLKGFTPDATILHKMLFQVAPVGSISKATSFLLKEGFWRISLDKKIVIEDDALTTTNEIPNEKIKAFHIQALKIALRGMSQFQTNQRKASTILVSVDKSKIPELRSLIDSFQNQLLHFIEENPRGSDELMQITIHLTPVGSRNET